MLTEMGGYQFWDVEDSIRDLYAWYERYENLDVEALRFDEKRLDEKKVDEKNKIGAGK
jgi:hypothetical protein